MPFVALQGRPLQSATIGYAITSNPVRPTFFIELEQLLNPNSYSSSSPNNSATLSQ